MFFHQEFQAVILAAGKGSRMPEITAGKPKCLLPVGNKPLIWYPLYKLQQTGFTEVILIILENQKEEIQSTLNKSDLDIKIDYFCITSNEDLGTADSLRLIHDKIKSDVILMSCDFISDVKLKSALDIFRQHNASVTAVLLNPEPSESVVVPGPKAKHRPERDLIGIDAQTNRLVFLASASDYENELSLPKSLIKKHSNITMHSNLIDSHIYILRRWVIKYLQHETGISTIKGELLPHIVRKQLSRPPVGPPDANTSILNSTDTSDIFSFATESKLDALIREASAYNDHFGDVKGSYHDDWIRCYAYVAGNGTFGVRVNTLQGYWSVNSKIIDKWNKITDCKETTLISPKAEVKSNQVDDRCIIWDSCKLNERTSFKNSIIASNTEVHSFSRIFNSIVMNNVTIKEKVAIENCIVCDGATIESGSQLKNCLIGSQHRVAENSSHTNEVITDSDRLMEF